MESNITLWDVNILQTKKLTAPIVFLAVLLVVGVAGNAIVVIIYHRKYTNSVYRTIIKHLAVVDLVFCLIGLPFNIVRLIFYYMFDDVVLCKMFTSILIFLINYSSHLLLLLAGHRFRQVCMPIRSQISNENVRKWIFLCFILSVLWTLPHPFVQQLSNETLSNNITGHTCPVSWEHHNLPSTVYNIFCVSVFITYATVLFFFYVLIGRKVYMQRQKMLKIKVVTDDLHKNITLIALTITAVFTVSYIPLFIVKLAAVNIHVDELTLLQFSLWKILERSYVINHVANPFIYAILDCHFRQQFKNLFICPYRRGATINSSGTAHSSQEHSLATFL